jgi:hypothetical protein
MKALAATIFIFFECRWRQRMTKARLDGLLLLLIGTVFFLLFGLATEVSSPHSMMDFKVVYYPTRCLIQGCDPYKADDVLHLFEVEEINSQLDAAKTRQIVTRFIYLPSAFLVTAPFAMLPWKQAHLLWLMVTSLTFMTACFLIWNWSANYAPLVSGALIGFFIANSVTVMLLSNAAGIAIGFCVIAVWCFLKNRFVLIGVLCLAVSLALKPQDAGLVWLYFLLAGGIYRRRALQTLFATIALSLPAVLWVWHVSPYWLQEWHSNILALAVHGGVNDPGPTSSGAHGLDMLVSLQTVFGSFTDDPHIYNSLTYLVCVPLLIVWGLVTLRRRCSPETTWLALGAIACLSMLPVYHRQLDTKLLLLTIPGCVVLWAKRNRVGRLALLTTITALSLTGDIPWVLFLTIIDKFRLPANLLTDHVLNGIQIFPVPLVLLATSAFYLWTYLRQGSADRVEKRADSQVTALPFFDE